MKKYNVDLKTSMPDDKPYEEYTRDEMIIKFMPLVETMARKFSTSDQASGILSILDMLQCGNEGLTRAVDKLDWIELNKSEDIEKTLKSFFSKRIKGAIRRRIDMHRGNMRIPEHQLNIFLSIDVKVNDEDIFNQIPDNSEPYNIPLMNAYLKSLMQKHLDFAEFEVLRLSYGLDCDKHSAKEIATKLGIEGSSNYVRISELKKKAVDKLIDNVDHSQVLDYL